MYNQTSANFSVDEMSSLYAEYSTIVWTEILQTKWIITQTNRSVPKDRLLFNMAATNFHFHYQLILPVLCIIWFDDIMSSIHVKCFWEPTVLSSNGLFCIYLFTGWGVQPVNHSEPHGIPNAVLTKYDLKRTDTSSSCSLFMLFILLFSLYFKHSLALGLLFLVGSIHFCKPSDRSLWGKE